MAARRPCWKWRRWKSIGFCLWPPSTCIWNLKLKFQGKLDLCSGNHVVYRQTDGRTDGQGESIIPLPPKKTRGHSRRSTLWNDPHDLDLRLFYLKMLCVWPEYIHAASILIDKMAEVSRTSNDRNVSEICGRHRADSQTGRQTGKTVSRFAAAK